MESSITERLMQIQDMSLKELRLYWRELYGTDTPHYNRAFLLKRLSYRLQELSFGGLSDSVKSRINQGIKLGTVPKPGKKSKPPAGTKLLREYDGVEHEVTVRHDGFEYQGQRFSSLSAVARKITGTRWNGPRFFGMRGNV